jgi:hypothetical protein
MRKRFMISLELDDLEKLDNLVFRFGSTRPVIIERALRRVHTDGLDLTSGQARELAEAMGGKV